MKLYILVGGSNGYNGGGSSGIGGYTSNIGGNGGGSTDVRIQISTNISDVSSLASRIMVAGACGGAGGSCGENQYVSNPVPQGVGHAGNGNTSRTCDSCGSGGLGGGSYAGFGSPGNKGDITTVVTTIGSSGTNGSFGIGGIGGDTGAWIGNYTNYKTIYAGGTGGGGGGGYFGGGAGGGAGGWWSGPGGNGGGGSSYISGHTGSIAITSSTSIVEKNNCTAGTTNNLCSIHYSGYEFSNTSIIDGSGYSWTNVKGNRIQMPNHNGGYYDLGIGNSGNGYAIITWIEK